MILQSQSFIRTLRSVSEKIVTPGHTLLMRGGYVRESVAGRYYLLPLGQRVQERIVGIIRDELNAVAALEMSAPTLHPHDLWEETNRAD